MITVDWFLQYEGKLRVTLTARDRTHTMTRSEAERLLSDLTEALKPTTGEKQ